MPGLSTGIIKSFDTLKGFGFITCEDGTSIIAYCTGFNDLESTRFQAGQRVTFNINKCKKGLQAVSVTKT